MMRVSSRQRLVSWEDFDAAAPEGADFEERSGAACTPLTKTRTTSESDATAFTTVSDSEASAIASPAGAEANAPEEISETSRPSVVPTSTAIYSSRVSPIDLATLKRKRGGGGADAGGGGVAAVATAKVAQSALSSSERKSFGNKKKDSAAPGISKPKKIGIAGSKQCAAQVVPSYPVAHRKSSSSLLLCPNNVQNLTDDMQMKILSYLDVQDVRSLMAVNHKYRSFILSDDAKILWREFLVSQWPWLDEAVADGNRFVATDLIDAFDTPIAAHHCAEVDNKSGANSNGKKKNKNRGKAKKGASEEKKEAGEEKREANLSLLLSLASTFKSSKVDASMFPHCRRQNRSRRQPRMHSHESETLLKTVEAPNGAPAVKFLGTVGLGDRCIRADQPLPRPLPLTKQQRRQIQGTKNAVIQHLRTKNAVIQHLKTAYHNHHHHHHNSHARDGDSEEYEHHHYCNLIWKPFVAPFVAETASSDAAADRRDEPSRKLQQLQLTPRLVSYFEVSIIPDESGDGDGQDGDADASAHGLSRHRTGLAAECVAVGIGTREFKINRLMPGWDRFSYGYHGDDGGIYHDNGHRINEYGPRFGANDVVGCGIDYLRGEVFYTHNGGFLGYAFSLDKDELLSDWYPVVGLDTDCLVQCNFGTDRPFVYDINQIIFRQKDVIKKSVIHTRHHNKQLKKLGSVVKRIGKPMAP